MELLGDSQTFLGTLATLTILCVLHNESNFIYRILKNVKENFQNEINSLRINTNFENVTKSAEYKLLSLYLNNPVSEPGLKEEGAKLMSKISDAKLLLQIRYATVEDKGDALIEEIYNSEEQVLAPLYSFGYCLIIFVFDELLRVAPVGHNDFLCSTLVVFCLFSIAFWVFIWGKFMEKYLLVQHGGRQKMKGKNCTGGKKRIKVLNSYLCKTGFAFGIMVAGLFLTNIFLPVRFYSYGLAGSMLLPIACIGIVKLFAKGNKKMYTHLFALGHLGGFVLLAVFFCLILFLYMEYAGDGECWLRPFQVHYFKMAIFAAILLNGLFLPFFMPYICYYEIYQRAQKSVKNSEAEAHDITSGLLAELRLFCEKIQA